MPLWLPLNILEMLLVKMYLSLLIMFSDFYKLGLKLAHY